jgi:hypothetical protein
VDLAYNDVKVIDYLDITEQGNAHWEAAKRRFGTLWVAIVLCGSMIAS